MISIVYGPELYYVRYYENEFLSKTEEDMNKAVFYSMEEVHAFLMGASLFAGVRRAVLKLQKLEELNNALFLNYLSATKDGKTDTQLMVILEETSLCQTKFCKNIKDFVSFIPCEKLPDAKFNGILEKMLKDLECEMTSDAKKLFLQRMAYQDNPDVTLITVENELGKIQHLESPITADTVVSNTSDYSKADCFRLINFLIRKDANNLYAEVEKLERDPKFSAIQTLSLLLREYRMAFKYHMGCSAAEIGAKRLNLQNCSIDIILNGLSSLTEIIRSHKSGILSESEAMKLACTVLLNDMSAA